MSPNNVPHMCPCTRFRLYCCCSSIVLQANKVPASQTAAKLCAKSRHALFDLTPVTLCSAVYLNVQLWQLLTSLYAICDCHVGVCPDTQANMKQNGKDKDDDAEALVHLSRQVLRSVGMCSYLELSDLDALVSKVSRHLLAWEHTRRRGTGADGSRLPM